MLNKINNNATVLMCVAKLYYKLNIAVLQHIYNENVFSAYKQKCDLNLCSYRNHMFAWMTCFTIEVYIKNNNNNKSFFIISWS